jgi:hypothetical protein
MKFLKSEIRKNTPLTGVNLMNAQRSPLHLIFASTLLLAWILLTITVSTARESSSTIGSYHASTGIFTSATGGYRATFETEPTSKAVALESKIADQFSDFAFSPLTQTSLSLNEGLVGVDHLTSTKLGGLEPREQRVFVVNF